jgi:hypothetical protein
MARRSYGRRVEIPCKVVEEFLVGDLTVAITVHLSNQLGELGGKEQGQSLELSLTVDKEQGARSKLPSS